MGFNLNKLYKSKLKKNMFPVIDNNNKLLSKVKIFQSYVTNRILTSMFFKNEYILREEYEYAEAEYSSILPYNKTSFYYETIYSLIPKYIKDNYKDCFFDTLEYSEVKNRMFNESLLLNLHLSPSLFSKNVLINFIAQGRLLLKTYFSYVPLYQNQKLFSDNLLYNNFGYYDYTIVDRDLIQKKLIQALNSFTQLNNLNYLTRKRSIFSANRKKSKFENKIFNSFFQATSLLGHRINLDSSVIQFKKDMVYQNILLSKLKDMLKTRIFNIETEGAKTFKKEIFFYKTSFIESQRNFKIFDLKFCLNKINLKKWLLKYSAILKKIKKVTRDKSFLFNTVNKFCKTSLIELLMLLSNLKKKLFIRRIKITVSSFFSQYLQKKIKRSNKRRKLIKNSIKGFISNKLKIFKVLKRDIKKKIFLQLLAIETTKIQYNELYKIIKTHTLLDYDNLIKIFSLIFLNKTVINYSAINKRSYSHYFNDINKFYATSFFFRVLRKRKFLNKNLLQDSITTKIQEKISKPTLADSSFNAVNLLLKMKKEYSKLKKRTRRLNISNKKKKKLFKKNFFLRLTSKNSINQNYSFFKLVHSIKTCNYKRFFDSNVACNPISLNSIFNHLFFFKTDFINLTKPLYSTRKNKLNRFLLKDFFSVENLPFINFNKKYFFSAKTMSFFAFIISRHAKFSLKNFFNDSIYSRVILFKKKKYIVEKLDQFYSNIDLWYAAGQQIKSRHTLSTYDLRKQKNKPRGKKRRKIGRPILPNSWKFNRVKTMSYLLTPHNCSNKILSFRRKKTNFLFGNYSNIFKKYLFYSLVLRRKKKYSIKKKNLRVQIPNSFRYSSSPFKRLHLKKKRVRLFSYFKYIKAYQKKSFLFKKYKKRKKKKIFLPIKKKPFKRLTYWKSLFRRRMYSFSHNKILALMNNSIILEKIKYFFNFYLLIQLFYRIKVFHILLFKYKCLKVLAENKNRLIIQTPKQNFNFVLNTFVF